MCCEIYVFLVYFLYLSCFFVCEYINLLIEWVQIEDLLFYCILIGLFLIIDYVINLIYVVCIYNIELNRSLKKIENELEYMQL